MALLVDAAALPVAERAEAVAVTTSEALARCYVRHEAPPPEIDFRLEAWRLGESSVIAVRSSGLQLLRTAAQAAREPTPMVLLAVQQGAVSRLQQHDHDQLIKPGEVFLVDLAAPYEYGWSGRAAVAGLLVPSDALALPAELIRAASANLPASPLYPLVANHLRQLINDAPRLSTEPAAAALGSASVELSRALLASASYQDRPPSPSTEALLTQVRSYVRAHLTDPDLQPARIATAHHISLRQLYKLCAEAGFSLQQWIISERLRGARDELAGAGAERRSIAQVARGWGFSDPAYFTRRFRAAYGITPREFRRPNRT